MENQTKKLYRSRKNRILGGVAGGLGEYFDIDPVLVRVVFVLLALINGLGFILYLLLLFVIPSEPAAGGSAETNLDKQVQDVAQELKGKAESLAGELKEEFKKRGCCSSPRNTLGLIVVILGAYFLLNQIFHLNFLRWDILWPVIIILIGFYIIFKKR